MFVAGGNCSRLLLMMPFATPPSLLDLGLTASLLQLLLDRLGFVLGDPLLDGLWRTFDEILGLLQAEAGELADDLDHLDLLVAGALEHDRPLVLPLGCRPPRRARGSNTRRCHHRRGSTDTELALELLHQGRRIHERHVLDVFLDLLARDFSHRTAP